MLVRYAILSLLQREELHGYKLKATFSDAVGSQWTLNFGQIYQCLKQLKTRGLVVARFDTNGGHIGRWVYKITPKGRRALETWTKRSPRAPEPPRDEIFIRLLAVADGSHDAYASHLANERRVHEQHLEHLQTKRQALDPLSGTELIPFFVLDAAVLQTRAHLGWIRRCERVLAERAHCEHPSAGTGEFAFTRDAEVLDGASLQAAN